MGNNIHKMINMSEKETCPYCGGEYKRLSVHLLYCKSKPTEEDTVEYFDLPDEPYIVDEDEEPSTLLTASDNTEGTWFTLEDMEVVEAQSTPCPYLMVIAGESCSTCRGTSCAASSDKKISDESYCRYEWVDCILYEEARDAGVRAMCPYLGLTIPEGRSACCGLWCHARDRGVRVPKVCYRWSSCGKYLEAKSDGKPFHRKAVT